MAITFPQFYERHVKRVYRYIYFRVGGRTAVAEDITSEVFLSALKAFDSYDSEQSDTAWIMTIARNKLINYWRDQKEELDIDELAFSLPGEDGLKTAENRDDIALLWQALADLKPHEKLLIEQKHLLGYKYVEMAKLLGKTVGAVRVETHRAFKKLKELLKNRI